MRPLKRGGSSSAASVSSRLVIESEEHEIFDPTLSGLLAVGSDNGDLAILNLKSNLRNVKIGRLYEDNTVPSYECHHTDNIVDFCLNLEQSHLLYTCSNGSIRLWDIRSPGPYHTFILEKHSSCIDFLSTENVLLTGDTSGSLKAWNIRTMTVECTHIPQPAKNPPSITTTDETENCRSITTIAVSPDNNWICVGDKKANVYEYEYKDKPYLLKSVVRGSENSLGGVVQCTFPRATPGPAVVAFHDYMGEYDSFEHKTDDKDITWSKDISSDEGTGITCCTVDAFSTFFFSGHESGQVSIYTLDNDVISILPVKFDGEINSLYYLKL